MIVRLDQIDFNPTRVNNVGFKLRKQEEEVARLKSNLQDEKVSLELKLTSTKNEFEESLNRLREDFDREKNELVQEQNEKCSK